MQDHGLSARFGVQNSQGLQSNNLFSIGSLFYNQWLSMLPHNKYNDFELGMSLGRGPARPGLARAL